MEIRFVIKTLYLGGIDGGEASETSEGTCSYTGDKGVTTE